VEVDWFQMVQIWLFAVTYGHDNNYSGSIGGGQFFDQLSNYEFLNKSSDSCGYISYHITFSDTKSRQLIGRHVVTE
jgi:hypothetical protein